MSSGPYGINIVGFDPSDGTDSTLNMPYREGFPYESEVPAGTNNFTITQTANTPNYDYQVAPTTGSEYIAEVQWFSAVVVTGSLAIGDRIEEDSDGNKLSNRSGIDSAVTLVSSDVFCLVRFKTNEVMINTTATLS